MSTNSTTEHHHNELIKRILIGFLVVFSILFAIQWISLSYSINNIKKEVESNNSHFQKVKTNLIDISALKSDSLTVTLNKFDIEKINSNLNSLSSEIYSEKNRAESIIDKDIDRLNLYMAIGIGFIAILGVFVPILVNILTNDDLKRKQEVLSQNLDNTKNEFKEIENVAKDAKEKSEKVFPKLTIITLQIAIHRLFNVSSLALSKIAKNPTDNSLFIELFKDVKKAIQNCKEDSIVINENNILQQTIKDCSELIMEEDYRFTTFGRSRNMYGEIEKLSSHLTELSQCSKEKQEEKYNQLISSFETFIQKLESLNA